MTAHNGLMQYFPEVCVGFIVHFCNALPTQLLPGVNRLDINEIVSGENLFKHRSSAHAIIILHTSILFFNKNWEACTQLVSRKMERYKVIKEVGDGTFGSVWRAINKQNSEVVAIKKMKKKYYSWEECMNLREVKSLRRMNHPNIVKLKEVIRENDILYFVFEYMECNLYQLTKARNKLFSETEIRNWCFQIFEALAYMHQCGYFHRDLKPENLLVTKDTIKIADFGLAREVGSQPPFTEYVSTRWYRAPEVLLQSSVYDSAVDMWAMGAIMAEMFTFRPLFPGSSEADEIYKICSVIGSPSENTWAEGMQLADVMKYQFPQLTSVHLSALIPTATKEAVDLISILCSWNPSKRPKAAEVLHHSFFQPCYYIPPSLRPRMTGLPNTPPSVGLKSSLEQKSAQRYSTGALNNMKTANSMLPAKVNASFRPGVQKKLETGYREPGKNDPSAKNSLKQSHYRPPARNNPVDYVGRNSWKVPDETTKMANIRANSVKDPDVAEKLSKMTVSAGLQQSTRQPHTSMKAGVWHSQTDFLRRSYEIPTGRSYSRKVAG